MDFILNMKAKNSRHPEQFAVSLEKTLRCKVHGLETEGTQVFCNQKTAQLTSCSSARRLGWYFLQNITSITTQLSSLSIFEMQIKPNSLPL